MILDGPSIGVMFVCMGNICRSPMAEAVFNHLVQLNGLQTKFQVTSTAIGDWHVGEKPHPGVQTILKLKGVPLSPAKRSIMLVSADLENYDYVLALDQKIVSNIQYMYGTRLRRLMEFAPPGSPLDVPDPYYTHKFELVYDLVSSACQGLLAYIREKGRV